MTLQKYPAKILGTPAKKVPLEDLFKLAFQDNIRALKLTMQEEGGIGIAAPQNGWDARVIIVKHGPPASGRPIDMVMVNPEIQGRIGTMTSIEGCLSFPGIEVPVERNAQVVVSYIDQYTKQHVKRYDGLTAVIIQHEIDHLDGVSMVDRFLDTPDRTFLIEYDPEYSKLDIEVHDKLLKLEKDAMSGSR